MICDYLYYYYYNLCRCCRTNRQINGYLVKLAATNKNQMEKWNEKQHQQISQKFVSAQQKKLC